jgi:hypothetical protein
MTDEYLQRMIAEGYPSAPAIGGDSYEVAAWLRQLRDFMSDFSIEESSGIDNALILFTHANPETRP